MADIIDRLNAALEGRYLVERELGEGGMATVYLAQDVRHERPVAMKVLRPELSAVLGADRFLAEIKTTANLQHPHILALYDSGEADGLLFYVMPYVEDESLRDRLDREKQLPVADAVRLAAEVADALEYAHRQSVIHRDIKPANVLLQDGRALVSDFGIALAVKAAGGARLTETGLSLGTPYYMSPEQVTGDREPDGRSDQYSLGCMLYEMLTGEPPFTGPTGQAVLARILTEDPPSVTDHRSLVAPNISAVVERSLEKLPADRFEKADDFRAALADPEFRHGSPVASASGSELTHRSRALSLLPWTVAAAAVAFALVATRPSDTPPQVTRVAIDLPADEEWMPIGVRQVALAVSPDGNLLAYTGREPSGGSNSMIWLRPLDQLNGAPVSGSQGGHYPQFSRDGAYLSFGLGAGALRQSGSVAIVPVGGGPPLMIEDVPTDRYSWGPDGRVYFGTQDLVTFAIEPGVAGRDTVYTTEGWQGHGPAWILPDARSSIFHVQVEPGLFHAVFADFDSGSEHVFLEDARNPKYVDSGHVLIVDGTRALKVVPFDPDTGEVTGPVVTVAQSVLTTIARDQFALSGSGTLAYIGGAAGTLSALAMLSRDGNEIERFDWIERTSRNGFAVSSDGRSLAADVGGSSLGELGSLYVFDLEDGTRIPLLPDGQRAFSPAWRPDGSAVSFVTGDSVLEVYPDGSGRTELALDAFSSNAELVWSQDGSTLVHRTLNDVNGFLSRNIYYIRPDTDTDYTLFLGSRFDEISPSLSPDGRWLAYVSDESGIQEVYVQPFPEGGRRFPISRGGGTEALWSRDGREIFYRAADETIRSVEVETEGGFTLTGVRAELFPADRYAEDLLIRTFDVTADARFIFGTRVEQESQPIVIVRNWMLPLMERLGG